MWISKVSGALLIYLIKLSLLSVFKQLFSSEKIFHAFLDFLINKIALEQSQGLLLLWAKLAAKKLFNHALFIGTYFPLVKH